VSNLQAAVAHGDASSSVLRRLAALGVVPSGVTDDSRQVRRGDLFLAYPGDLADGRRYIAEAISHGAAAVLWEENPVAGGEFSWHSGWQIANLPINGLRTFCGPLGARHLRASKRALVAGRRHRHQRQDQRHAVDRQHPSASLSDHRYAGSRLAGSIA
jgi:UDP-N-acetylmuramyl pentapeptide synthase